MKSRRALQLCTHATRLPSRSVFVTEVGSIFQENEVRNRCSDINFNGYNADSFTVGVEGARQGVIIDLGTSDDLQKKYGYSDGVGKVQGFASLRLTNGKFYVLKDLRARTSQELSEGGSLLQNPTSETQTAPVRLGHVYLMKLTDSYEKDFALVVKLVVVASVPNESVTFRWQVL